MDEAKTRNRQRIIEAASGILEREGAQAVSTRSVAAAAGIRPASLYQFFGDKEGLLSALALHAFDVYLAEKQALVLTGDPIDDMRRGWDAHVEFGLCHPAFYLLMFGTDRPYRRPPAAHEAHDLLLKWLDRVAAAGCLRVPPALAAGLFQAAASGVTLSLIGTPAENRDLELSSRMRDALIENLTTYPSPSVGPGLASQALALDAALTAVDPADLPLRPTEAALLRDWLHRLAH
ncbi:TetR/AcrR family transcriptional regulator [Streptomyces sp. NPDC096048]|uniref:TetR/AcrR family transcriptional regulator n=1 Tax=Streptomyces sp. NPDC096048 TaxID=3366072 RepID=UPI00381C765B